VIQISQPRVYRFSHPILKEGVGEKKAMSKRYLVLFQGLTEQENSFKNRVLSLGVSSETADTILRKTPVILKSGMSAEKAKKYATAFREAGAKVTIMQELKDSEEPSMGNPSFSIPTFGDFTMCPECGMKQPRGKSCERCGYTFVE
jgi:hypothetical protein